MPEAARCPKCYWGRLTYPLEIERQQCVGCMSNGWRNKPRPVRTGLPPMWPLREVYRSEAQAYGEDIYDDD